MTARAAPTAASRIEALRERIGRDAPEITRRIREAASANPGNEARFRSLFAQVIEPWANALDIPLLAREERTLATGRADATYNRLVIEYEAPGRLRDNCDHGATAHAIQQAKDYVEGVARAERQQIHRLIGVVIDGCYFIYVRKVDGHWTDPEVEPVNDQSVARFLRLLVSLTSGKALLPENLLQDFGSNTIYAQRIASSLYQSLARTLDDDQVDLVDKLFEQWQTFFGEVTGYEEESHPLRNRPELREFARGMGLDVRNVDPPRLFFTVHTYFALLIKLIAYYALSRFVSGFGTRFGSMYHLGDDDLKREMQELERGGIFRTLGIRNFLEGDFFKWYLDAWDADVARAIRTLLERLKDYDPGTLEVSPEQARDLLKRLYHGLMPRELRHDLGEFYTPDWLAEHVLNEVGYDGNAETRLLDPACGSGTFLVLAIRRLRDKCFRDGRNEQETLDIMLQNIAGIDLNPLAVIAARTNFVLALGDLLVHRTTEIDLPVYLADSILTPAAGGDLFRHDRYELKTVVGDFDIPSTLNRREQIDSLCHLLEECVAAEVAEDVFLDRTRGALDLSDPDWLGASGGGQGEGARSILQTLYRRLTALHAEGLDGIWARILQNAFMPLFLGEFDVIAGNPPWIGWESLPDAYRRATHPLWVRYGLFPHGGMDTILGRGKKDLSMLMSYVVSDRLLKHGGRLGYVITQSVFKTAGAGQGFRRFRFQDGAAGAVITLGVARVHDLTDFQAFEGASTRTATFVWEKGRAMTYPVEYVLWQKTAHRQAVDQDASLTEVLEMTRRLPFAARPVNRDDATSPWLTARPAAVEAITRLLGRSQYEAHLGVNSGGANSVYWVSIVHERPDDIVVVQNITDGARRAVEQVTVDIEALHLYPLLRGVEVRRWKARPAAKILLVQDPTTKRGIAESRLERESPRTHRYLKRFEEPLRRRAAFQRYFTRENNGQTIESGPFYSMFDVGAYTLAPIKVVWHRMVAPIGAAVVEMLDGRPVIPQETHAMVAVETLDEAHYLAGVMNSTPFNFAALAYSQAGGKSFGSPHILENLHVPRFNPQTPAHREVGDISRAIHARVAEHPDAEIADLEARLDAAVAAVYMLSENELSQIAESMHELTKGDLRALREAAAENADGELAATANNADGLSADVVIAAFGPSPTSLADAAASLSAGVDLLRPLVRALVADGRLVQVGRGRGTRYCVGNPGAQA
ncbi:MAG: N-6 DNA methylase [Phycisphaeraceae bacterium]|nr:N-6 DNA methylase [Phycisphaeraceae bacterium]